MAGKEAKLSEQEMRERILENDFKTSERKLRAAEREEARYEQEEALRHKKNTTRQKELADGRRTMAAIQKACRHMSGGKPGNVLKGGGIGSFSIITRYKMPDGVTYLLQCARCRMMLYTPTKPAKAEFDKPALFEAAMKAYEVEKAHFDELFEKSMDAGLEEMRGPTFMFKNADGVPVIPARV